MRTGPALYRAMLALGSCAMAGCSHTNTGANIPPGGAVMTNAQPPPPAGTIQSPLPASFGSTPAPTQIAQPASPAFDGISGPLPAADTSFPLLVSSLSRVTAATGPGWTADANSPSATATIISATPNSARLKISIPSLNLNDTFDQRTTFYYDSIAKSAQLDLSYVGFGYWTFPQVSGPGMERVFGVYGYETSSAAMPASGTASFSGPGKMNANVYDSNGRIVAAIGGDAFFSVDFASGNLMGTFTKNSGSDINCLPYPFPDVSVKAGIAAGSNQFRGTTAVASQPAIPAGGTPPAYNLGTSATGSINGAFYGPAAQNLGAVWTLSDGHTSVLGTVGAAR
jgi:hypothetical protein